MPDAALPENVLAIVGDGDVILGFKALGFRTYILEETGSFEIIFDGLVRDKIAVCLIQDKLYHSAKDVIDSHKDLPLPIIVPFTLDGSAGDLDNLVKNIRLRATGAL